MDVLTFSVADERYAIDIATIQEICEAPQRFFIPTAPEYLQGAINFHGAITPVVDLAGLLGMPEVSSDERVIVLRQDICNLALAVHTLGSIIAVSAKALLPCHEPRDNQFCEQHLLSHDNQMINILDMSKVLAHLERVE